MLEGPAFGKGLTRQLVESTGRVVGREHHELAAAAEAGSHGPAVADQLRRRPERDDLARPDHRDAVCELRLVQVVRREEDGLPERAERADHLPGGAARGGVEAGRRLVQEDEAGVADERDAEVEPPLLPARERLHARVALLGEPTRSISSSTSRGFA